MEVDDLRPITRNGIIGERPALIEDRASIERVESRQRPQQERLAGARLPDHCQASTKFNPQIDIVQEPCPPVRVATTDILGFKERRGGWHEQRLVQW